MCVCCVFVPSILAIVPPIKVKRVLHFAVHLENWSSCCA